MCRGVTCLGLVLAAIENILAQGTLNMEIIVNPKHLDSGHDVIQLETAVGAAMKCFDRGIGAYNKGESLLLAHTRNSHLLC